MIKPNFFVILFLFFTSFETSATDLSNNQNQKIITENQNYRFSEKQAREKIEKTIGKKFGEIKKYSPELIWPFRSDENVDKIRLANNELREIRNIAEENIKAENTCKKVMVRKAFIKYVVQKVKKPVKKVKVEWKEFEKQIPVTDFKNVERKRYDQKKLKQNIYANTIEFICKKSYDYSLEKTGNKAVAEAVQKIIAKDLAEKMGQKGVFLDDFLGKNREAKIDQIIEKLNKK